MRRLFTLGVGGMLLVMLLPMVPATATPSLDVTFDYEFIFGAPEGEFSATGTAVDDGTICPAGTIEEVLFKQSHDAKNVTTVDRFVCDEAGGFGPGDAFIMKAQVHIDFPDFVGRWVTMGGTGAFERIHATGTVDGSFIFDPFGVDETRAGSVHLD